MTDRELILRKLTSLSDHVARVRRRRPEELEVFRADIDRQDAVAMSLLVAVQEALDIALHLASDEGWGVPASYAESFELLQRHNVLDHAMTQRLVNLATLRNRIAHGYASVDAERIWRELPEGVATLQAFAAVIARYLGPDPGAAAS